jgi:hypothetical protein
MFLTTLNKKRLKTLQYTKKVGGDLLSSTSKPKERFYSRLNEQDYLGLTIWAGKTDPNAEVLTVQLRRREGDNWETIGRLAVYRSSNGVYSKLPERQSRDQSITGRDTLEK